MKSILMIALLAAGGFAPPKPEFSIAIRPEESTVKAGEGVVVEVRRTNTSNHVLCILGFNRAADFTYDVRRDGLSVGETEHGKNLRERGNGLSGVMPGGSMTDCRLPSHQIVTDTIGVSAYREMSQPGKYTIQLQQGTVKSNVVTVTVEP